MNTKKHGWLKPLLDALEVPSKVVEYADELVYHLADPLAIIRESVDLKQGGFIQEVQVHFARGLGQIYKDAFGEKYESQECVAKINDYLKSVYPDLSPSSIINWRKKTDESTGVEKFIVKRLSLFLGPKENGVWWIFYNNAQIFLDFYLFRLFCFAENNAMIASYLRDQKDYLNFSVLKVIAAAAHADGEIASAERELFHVFVKHNFLSDERKKVATAFLDSGADVHQLELTGIDSWALKKFLLELAISTIWSDGHLDTKEEEFIEKFLKVISLQQSEMVLSFLRVESFMLALVKMGMSNSEMLEDSFLNRTKGVLSAYNHEIIATLNANESLFSMLKKASKETVSSEEQDDLAKKIILALQTMRVFRGITFANLFWSYEKVLKILPKSIVRTLVS